MYISTKKVVFINRCDIQIYMDTLPAQLQLQVGGTR